MHGDKQIPVHNFKRNRLPKGVEYLQVPQELNS